MPKCKFLKCPSHPTPPPPDPPQHLTWGCIHKALEEPKQKKTKLKKKHILNDQLFKE